MPKLPTIRQAILDYLWARSFEGQGVVIAPIASLHKGWKADRPESSGARTERAFRQALANLKDDGYIDYETANHHVGPITVLRDRVTTPCPEFGNHIYYCACGKKLAVNR
jgi:hypothetical protein